MDGKEADTPAEGHAPVLLHEVLEHLDIQPHETVLDATLGGAGHARALAAQLDARGTLIGIDADSAALERARGVLTGSRCSVHLAQANFRDLAQVLEGLGITKLDAALFDLGWSSYQLAAGRGFSFMHDEPLLMTYASEPGEDALTARSVVNGWEEENIADVLWGWGEERYARRIARAITKEREQAAIETSTQLADIVARAVPATYRHKRIHPATKTFQALRIAVNDELGVIENGLEEALAHLVPEGRIAVITFHSTEDRLVKRLFRDWAAQKRGTASKAIKPSEEEVRTNARARSAKLRIFQHST